MLLLLLLPHALTGDGIARFEAIANDVADLVLEFGGALSGEHGDGMVRGPFTKKMFGPVLYEAFRTVKRAFDPDGLFNPGKIIDTPPLTANLRYGAAYNTADPPTYFDYSEFGGMGRAVESNLGANFTCDVLKIAMIKDASIARQVGGKLFDLVCKFQQPRHPERAQRREGSG